MTGRPSKRTPEVVEKILALLRDEGRPLSLSGACSECDIDPTTFRDWMRSDPDLASSVRISRGKGQAVLERRVLSPEVSAPEANVIRHRLARLDIDEWGDVQVTVPSSPITIADLMRADDADRKRDP